jgi:hypothetical protein
VRNFKQWIGGLCDNRFRQTKTLSDLTYNNIKSGWIKHCHFGQCFAVEFTTNFFETRNKLTIPQTSLTARCIDPDNPKASKISFPAATVSLGEHSCSDYGLFCGTQKPPTAAN